MFKNKYGLCVVLCVKNSKKGKLSVSVYSRGKIMCQFKGVNTLTVAFCMLVCINPEFIILYK